MITNYKIAGQFLSLAPTIRYDVGENFLSLFFEDGSLTDRNGGVGARRERGGKLVGEPNITRPWRRGGEEEGIYTADIAPLCMCIR